MKLFTAVDVDKSSVTISPGNKTTILGSCFADSMGGRLSRAGMDICLNPFGTLYNPESICNAVSRLDSGQHFTKDDCVEMGAGAGLICSFWHHSSFARANAEEFLDNANICLDLARERWISTDRVIVTLGTAQVWRLHDGRTVSNCLKRPATEFRHEMLDIDTVSRLLGDLVASHPDKSFIFTVSPIRHLGEGAHTNTLSKATLQLGTARVLGERSAYFPSYEILLDELRDYRFFASDLVHPSDLAEDIIWERFVSSVVPERFHQAIREAEKESRRQAHRKILNISH